jgi:transposase-like protein
MHTSVSLYHRHRFPAQIISHCVWLYFRFALSFRDVEEMLAMRGVSLSYETVREWCLKFGQTYANDLRRRSPRPGDRWHLDEVFLKINGRLHYLWRAVDQGGGVLDILVQSRRDKKAAKKFFRKLLKRLRYVPRALITDKLKSYSAARAEGPVSNTSSRVSEQPSRELTSDNQIARKGDEAVQVGGTCSTFPLGLRADLITFPSGAAPLHDQFLPSSNEGQIRRLGRSHWRPASSLSKTVIHRQVVSLEFTFLTWQLTLRSG